MKRPPSEKESGVTLSTPMTSGRSSDSSKRPQRSAIPCPPTAGSELRGARGRLRVGAGVRTEGRIDRARRRLRRPRRTALHDVLDLLGVERLPLEQRLGHRFDLVAVLLDELARQRVLLVDDPPDFLVDLLHGRLGDVLLRRDRAAEENLAL